MTKYCLSKPQQLFLDCQGKVGWLSENQTRIWSLQFINLKSLDKNTRFLMLPYHFKLCEDMAEECTNYWESLLVLQGYQWG